MQQQALARKSMVGPTIFTAFGLALLLTLGTWQVQRLHWKLGLIAARQAALTATPVPLPRTLDAARPLEFHPVRAVGQFRYDHELYLHATDADGDAGYHVVTPLVLAEGGGTLMVDRGFVPEERKSPATRAAGNPGGTVTVTGLLRLPTGKSSWFVPDNLPARNEWFTIDLGAMAAAAGVTGVLPFYVDADRTPNPGGYPVGGQTLIDLPNNHLQYALTWYMLAGSLVIVYVLLLLRRRRGETQ